METEQTSETNEKEKKALFRWTGHLSENNTHFLCLCGVNNVLTLTNATLKTYGIEHKLWLYRKKNRRNQLIRVDA